MYKKEKTADIENILGTEKGLKKYLDQYNHQNVTEVDTLLYQILENKKIKQSYLIKRSGVSRVYAYEVLRGTKHPSRDTLLRFLITLSLGFEEIQQALKVLSYPILYAKNKRDAIIIYGIKTKLDVDQICILLYDSKNEIL